MRDQEILGLQEAYSAIYESQEVEYIDERKYEADEKLPSGKTPNEKMEKAQSKHGANYMLSKGDVRYPGAKNAHFERGTKVKKIKDIIKSGGDPRNDPSAGPGNDYDARKIGRPQKPMTGKKRRRDETDRERSNYTPGGLRADRTKAGGYRTLVRKEETDLFDYLLEYLVAEGYADTNKAAINIMANMSEEWMQSIMEMDDFSAGGGNAKMKQTGMSRDQVIALGKKNLAAKPAKSSSSPKPNSGGEAAASKPAPPNNSGTGGMNQRRFGRDSAAAIFGKPSYDTPSFADTRDALMRSQAQDNDQWLVAKGREKPGYRGTQDIADRTIAKQRAYYGQK